VAPEQQYRLKVDERADQYSLASLTYELLTGQLPLGVFKPPSRLNPRLGPEVDAVILRALQESPKDRFATIREFTDALERSLAAIPSSPRRSALRRLAWAGLGLLVIAGMGTLYVAWPGARPSAPSRSSHSGPRDAGIAKIGPDAPPVPATKKPPPSLSEDLKRFRARKIWEARGRPTGPEGEAVKDEIWFEAARSIEAELKEIAYGIWEARGRPTGPEGEAVKDEIWFEAERRLYKGLSGEDPPDDRSP
jgi:serine/threonine protein kinase